MTLAAGDSTGTPRSSEARPDLRQALTDRVPAPVCAILEAFATAAATTRDALVTAPLDGMLGATGATNVQNESTAKLDEFANDTFEAALRAVPGVARMISEEIEDPVEVGDGPYTVCFDPLDGSSNIGMAPVGSVLGIYEGIAVPSEDHPVDGSALVAAAFAVYGVPSVMIIATAEGADGFAFDPADRTWRLAFPSIRIPKSKYASINWMYRPRWPEHVAAAVDAASDGLGGRYSGSMVEDVLRVILAGGVFLYPEDTTAPTGKLRMLYEVAPIGFIMRAAGGDAIEGRRSVLEVPITTPHQRGPMIAGSADAIERYRAAYSRE